MKLKILAVSVLGLMLGTTVFAAEFNLAHERNDRNVNISPTETHKNLYAAGASVNVSGTTLGDLFAAGGVVSVNGNVEKDLVAASGTITVNGSIGDNARVAGGSITINAPIGSDLLAGGGTVDITDKATIGGDLVAAGGSVIVNSEVKGKKSYITGGDIVINGKFDGDLDVTANKSLTFGPNSEVTGTVTYRGFREATISSGAKVAFIQYTKTQPNENDARHIFRAFFAVATLLKLLMLLVAGLVISLLFPARVTAMLAQIRTKTWQNLGIGFLALIATPIASVILMVTVVGAFLGIILLVLYFLAILLASVLMLFYTGNLVSGWLKQSKSSHMRDLLIGTLVVLILSFIPVLGWLAVCILFMITFGGMIIEFRQSRLG